ncbi:MAG: hypothetical protein WCA21_12890 [Terracidiphilus sp.]
MNRLAAFASMLVLFVASAFGVGNKPQTVIIPENVQVGSTQLAAGTYKLAFTGTGSDVKVTLTQAGKTVLTFAAKVVEQRNNPGVDLYTNAGVTTLKSINLDTVSLQVDGAPLPGQ